MSSQNSSIKSFRSLDFKNFNEEQLISQINSMLINGDLSNTLFIEIVKEVMLRSDSIQIIIKIINFFWTLDMKDIESFIYIIVNSLTCIDKASSYFLLDHIKTLITEENLLQKSILSLIPTLVGNIRLEDDFFTGYMDISTIHDKFDNLIALAEVMRQMNTLTGAEKTLFIKKLLDMLYIVDLELCPKFVNEILLLCDHTNFQYCVGAVVNFFNQKPISCSQLSQSSINFDSQKLIRIQTLVLNYYFEIGKVNCEFSKEILKLCKNNNSLYSISGFMCIILLNLAGLEYIKDQILNFLVQCITNCYMDTKLLIESGFIREAINDNFNMDSLLINAVKYCCVSEREFISTSLLELGFLLIKSGLPRSKVINLNVSKSKVKKDDTLISKMCNNDMSMSTPQKVGQAGIQMIVHLFRRLIPYREAILENIQNFLLKQSHKSSVFVYLELFADLIALMPMEIFEYIDQAQYQPIFELLCNFPEEVALGLVNALLPLIRFSSSIRNKLISILMTNILSGRFHTRMICVKSALILLKYLRITVDQFGSDLNNDNQTNHVGVLTQCSQFACTQIAAQSKPLAIDNFANDEICTQILQIIDESCNQHPDTKVLIYKGLVQVIERNFYFSGQVVLFLLRKLRFFMRDNETKDNTDKIVNNPFILSKLLIDNNCDGPGSCGIDNEKPSTVVVEQISGLVSCLAESIRYCKKSMPAQDILTNAIHENKLISNAVDKAESTIREIFDFLMSEEILEVVSANDFDLDLGSSTSTVSNTRQMIVDQFIDLYDILLVHFICSYENKVTDSINSDHSISQFPESIEKLLLQKEKILQRNDSRRLPVNKKILKDNEAQYGSSVLSLSTLNKSIQYLFQSLIIDLENTNSGNVNVANGNQKTNKIKGTQKNKKKHQQIRSSILELSLDASRVNNVTVEETTLNINVENDRVMDDVHHNGADSNDIAPSTVSFSKEKVVIYLLNRAIALVRKIGSAQYRISHRNREETCTVLTDLTKISLNYYVTLLCLESNVIDDLFRSSSSTKLHNQIQQLCIVLYCASFNKIIQFCTKEIDSFLCHWSSPLKDHLKSLQKSMGLLSSSVGTDKERGISESIFEPLHIFTAHAQHQQPIALSSFVKLHKLIVSRILILSQRKLLHEIDTLLSLTTDIAIYCGIDNARQNFLSSDVPTGAVVKNKGLETSLLNSRITINWLNSLNVWTYNLLKSGKLHFKLIGRETVVRDIYGMYDSNMCQCLLSMCLTTARIIMPDFVNFLEKIVTDISVKIGSYSTMMVVGNAEKCPKNVSFEFIIHPTDLLTEIINATSLALDDVDWLLMKWKCGWQEFKQRKAINNSQLSYLNSTPSEFIETSLTTVIEQDRHIFQQLYGLCSIITKMIGCSITNVTRLYSLVKLCTRLFDQLTFVTKQYIFLTKSKLGGCSDQFEKLVRISGGNLSPQASQFIVYIQKIESICRTTVKDDKKKYDELENEGDMALTNEHKVDKKVKNIEKNLDNQLGRTEKDMKLIPNLVFSIEQYQRYLIELQKVAKIDLMIHVRTLNSRDFRIDLVKLQESLDKNATIYMSEDDDDEHDEEDNNNNNNDDRNGNKNNTDNVDDSTTITNQYERKNKGSRIDEYGSPPKKKQRI